MSNLYFLYYLRYSEQDLIDQATGTTFQAVSGKVVRNHPVPLAPAPVQHLIVAEIEKQFTRLDAAVAALRRAKANLARYKAAVLKAAVEGRLVAQDPNDEPAAVLLARILAERRAQWEAANPKKPYVEPKGPDVAGLPRLPVGWVWATVEQVAEVGTGATPKRENNLYWAKGTVAWLTSSVVNSEYVAEAEEYITETALRETNAKIFPSGTLLVAMYGEGKTRGKVTEMRLDAATNQALAALTFHPPADWIRPFVKFVLMAGYEAMRRLSSGGVQPNLNLSHIKQTIVPMPPIEEQKRITFEVDRHLSVIQATQQVITANLARAEGLRQGVLGKAFRGELV
jgi:type I restriction enzyme S subunit